MSGAGAILLAGGQSSRMGSDKAALVLDGQTLLERMIRTVSPLVDAVVVMLSPMQAAPNLPDDLLDRIGIGRDSQRAKGPLQGIADALPLLSAEKDPIFVLSCDLPYLTTPILERMMRSLTPIDEGICAETQGRKNPLLAVYRRQVLEEAVRPSAAGRSCMVLIDNHRIQPFHPPADHPQVFDDTNTPQAFEKAKASLANRT